MGPPRSLSSLLFPSPTLEGWLGEGWVGRQPWAWLGVEQDCQLGFWLQAAWAVDGGWEAEPPETGSCGGPTPVQAGKQGSTCTT